MDIIDSIFPKQCIICSKVGEDICKNCLRKIPRCLPQCPICHKLNNGYYTHKKCCSKQIQCFTGWSITKEQENNFKQKISEGIISVYRYMLVNITLNLSIKETIRNSFVFPIYSKDYNNNTFNKILYKDLRSYGKKQFLLYIGFNLENIDFIIKESNNKANNTEIKVLTLFNVPTL